ncbi:c-type cytochrome [Dehalogenimonas sp. 4OHTPN]|uniref:C-type cytochrome n=1 Tax=Dehalogenimonas sp. 4OHTPN TaxID=3166643 RepID=A0AAU8GEB5_9CHLR
MRKHDSKVSIIPGTIVALLVLVLPVLGIGGCTGSTTEPTATTTPPPTTADGTLLPTVAGVDATLLYSSKCASCHGTNRQGGVAPALTDVSNFSASFLSSFFSVHFTGVGMAEPLRNSLANYLKTNSVTPPPQTGPIDPAAVYAANCSLCHGAFRQGGLAGPNITPNQITNFTTEARLSTFISAHQSGQNLDKERRDLVAKWLKETP